MYLRNYFLKEGIIDPSYLHLSVFPQKRRKKVWFLHDRPPESRPYFLPGDLPIPNISASPSSVISVNESVDLLLWNT